MSALTVEDIRLLAAKAWNDHAARCRVTTVDGSLMKVAEAMHAAFVAQDDLLDHARQALKNEHSLRLGYRTRRGAAIESMAEDAIARIDAYLGAVCPRCDGAGNVVLPEGATRACPHCGGTGVAP